MLDHKGKSILERPLNIYGTFQLDLKSKTGNPYKRIIIFYNIF